MSNLPSDHPKYWEFQDTFSHASNERLITIFQYELTHPGFFADRHYFMAALQDEIINRGYNLSQTLLQAKNWRLSNSES